MKTITVQPVHGKPGDYICERCGFVSDGYLVKMAFMEMESRRCGRRCGGLMRKIDRTGSVRILADGPYGMWGCRERRRK